MKHYKVKHAVLTSILMLCTHLSTPTSLEFRQAAFSDHLTPYPVIMSSLVYQITQLLGNMDQYLSGFQKNALLETNQELQDLKTATQQIQNNTTEILNINAFDSNYTGALPVFNLGGTTHNDTTINYWDQPLYITSSDTQFDGVNIIRLQENIIYKPAEADVSGSGPYGAIIIEKDNMVIDLFGFSLILDDSNIGNFDEDACPVCSGDLSDVKTVHGIYIKPGIKNTRIISSMGQHAKGSIRDFTGFAIYAQGASGAANNIEQLMIDNISVADNFSGISVEYAANVSVTNSDAISNCCLNAVYGMSFTNVTDLFVASCKSNSNASCDDVYGIFIKDTIGALVQNCEASYNESAEDGSAYGITITASSSTSTHSNKLENCTANENLCAYAHATQSIGIYLTGSSYNNIVQDCTSLSNTHGAIPDPDPNPTTPPKGYGIKLENSNFNELHGNKIGTHLTYGIYDSLTASTSIFTKNVSFYSPTNYSVNFQSASGTTDPLNVVTLFPGDLSAMNTATSQLQNVEIKKVEAS